MPPSNQTRATKRRPVRKGNPTPFASGNPEANRPRAMSGEVHSGSDLGYTQETTATPHIKRHESPLGYDPNDRGRQAQTHCSAPAPIPTRENFSGVQHEASPSTYVPGKGLGT